MSDLVCLLDTGKDAVGEAFDMPAGAVQPTGWQWRRLGEHGWRNGPMPPPANGDAGTIYEFRGMALEPQ